MKRFGLAHLTGLSRHGSRMILVTALLGAFLTFGTSFSSLAFAATTGSGTHPAPAKSAASGTPAGYILVDAISETPAASSSASNPCKTVTFQQNYNGAGNTIAWLKMVTEWCYNDLIVTSHSTVLSWGVTAFGSALGWYIEYPSPRYSFNCYVASGSGPGCSGNHEWTEQFWANGSAGVGLALTVDEWETYNGQSSTRGGTQNCVGKCG
jgi:hypothetical protein